MPGTYLLQASLESVDAAVDKFLHPGSAAADKAAAAATGTKPKTEEPTGPPPSEVSVEVLNGNGVAGSADEAAYVLGQRGCSLGERRERRPIRLLRDDGPLHAGHRRRARGRRARRALRRREGRGGAGRRAPRDDRPRDRRSDVPRHALRRGAGGLAAAAGAHGLGRHDDQGGPRAKPVPPRLPGPGSERDRDGAHISTLEGVRAYRLNGEQAVRVTYQSPDGIEYWGIQQTA